MPEDGTLDVLATILQLGSPAVVWTTEQAQVARLRITTLGARMAMIVFQPGSLLATPTCRVNPAAAEAVALDDLAPRSARNVWL